MTVNQVQLMHECSQLLERYCLLFAGDGLLDTPERYCRLFAGHTHEMHCLLFDTVCVWGGVTDGKSIAACHFEEK